GAGTSMNSKPSASVSLPPGVVTSTSTIPATCGGVVAVIWVGLSTVKLVAGVPPKVSAVAPVRSVPMMVTEVPPAVLPVFGVTEGSGGGGTSKAKPSARVSLPPGVVTSTSTKPAAWAGVVAVIWVGLSTVKLVAGVSPMVSAVAPVRSVPMMVTEVPPAVLPVFGVTEVSPGVGISKVKPSGSEARPAGVGASTTARPAAWVGVGAVICVVLSAAKRVAGAPREDSAAGRAGW